MSEFRAATAADLPAVQSLARAGGLPDWGEAGWREELRKPHAVLLVDDGLNTFGLCWVIADVGEIAGICVAPAARKSGHGRRMLCALMAAAKARGATVMWLEVSAANQAAIRLYTRAGFVAQRRRARYYRDGSDAIEMSVPL